MDPNWVKANSVNVTQFSQVVAKRPSPQTVIRQVMNTAKVLALAGVREHFTSQQSPDGVPWKKLKHARPDGSAVPLQDKGLLLGSIKATLDGTSLTLKASHPGARVHQFGAIIVPRAAKMLAIPLTVEAKRAGSPKRFRRPLFSLTTKKGNVILAETRKGALTMHFVLKDSVYIPPRPYLGFSARTLAKIEKVVADRFADSIAAIFLPQSVALRVSM